MKKAKEKIMSYFSPKFNFFIISVLFIGFPFSSSNSIVWTCLSVNTNYEINYAFAAPQTKSYSGLLVSDGTNFSHGFSKHSLWERLFWGKDRPGKMRVLLDSPSRLDVPERIWGGVPLSTRKGQVLLLSLTL